MSEMTHESLLSEIRTKLAAFGVIEFHLEPRDKPYGATRADALPVMDRDGKRNGVIIEVVNTSSYDKAARIKDPRVIEHIQRKYRLDSCIPYILIMQDFTEAACKAREWRLGPTLLWVRNAQECDLAAIAILSAMLKQTQSVEVATAKLSHSSQKAAVRHILKTLRTGSDLARLIDAMDLDYGSFAYIYGCTDANISAKTRSKTLTNHSINSIETTVSLWEQGKARTPVKVKGPGANGFGWDFIVEEDEESRRLGLCGVEG